jgi:hypothetical protein
MHFAYSFPWWVAVLVAGAIGGLAFVAYRRPLAPLTRAQRGALIGLRVLVLTALILVLCRPVVLLPPASAREAIVPVLVDVSRSMRLADADGESRIARASALIKTQLLPELSHQFTAELYTIGDGVAPIPASDPGGPGGPGGIGVLGADARRTDLAASLDAVRDRYRGQRVAGIVVLSDGGETGQKTAAPADGHGPPVFAIGIGSADGPRDREILGVTTSDPKLDHASVDLRVSAVSYGFGRTPFQVRILANGRPIDTRRVVPPADGSPIDETFTVSPDPLNPTVFTAEIPADEAEAVVENNARSVLVAPAGRKRRLLVIEGAPGFEHSFMKRALALDPGLEIDAVTRKGKNADGQHTFFVQAGAGRTSALTAGFPARREDLYAYDALVIANVEGDFFTRAQLAMAADFVAERGGGLLVMGGRSFAQRGLIGTPLEIALPVELNDRRGVGGVVRASLGGAAVPHNKLVLTADGENHPLMRIGDTLDETRRLWAALPPLAASAPLGDPRPGATVLAVTGAAGGALFPVVAAQRYGRGRSMIFAGEASWRWKMMLASTDRTHEMFWRHVARWLAGPAPDPVTIAVPDAPEPGDTVNTDVEARDSAFDRLPDAAVDATLTSPGAEARPLKLRPADGVGGRFTAPFHPDQPGLYRIDVNARRGAAPIGAATQWVLVGGSDREFADPRLNEGVLRRVARNSGGRYVRAADASRVVSWLQSGAPQNAAPERRDLWHEPWAFALIAALLAGEWILRRRWGLR